MKYYILMLIGLLAFTGCEEFVNTAEESAVTYLPTITVEGETSVVLPCDYSGPYTDPGATATESGAEIPLKTQIGGIYFEGTTVDGPDLYNITYSAYNVDSIPGAVVRKINWPECNGDLITSIAGMYKTTILRNGTNTTDYVNKGPFFIRDMGSNVYQLSDAIGGWYDFGRKLGPAYAAPGMTITANNIVTNSFTFGGPVEVGSFGGEVEMLTFTVDPVKKEIKFSSYWDFDYTFEVTLTQVEQ